MRTSSLAIAAVAILLATPALAQDAVWIANFPDVQRVEGAVSLAGPIPSTDMIRYEDVTVSSVRRADTTRLIQAGVLESRGFGSVVLSLAAEIKGTVPAPAKIGVVLVPDEGFVLDALAEGHYLFPIEVELEVEAESVPYVAADPEAHLLAFPRYRVYLYNTGKRTVKAQLYAMLTNRGIDPTRWRGGS